MRVLVTTSRLHHAARQILESAGADVHVIEQDVGEDEVAGAFRRINPEGVISREATISRAAIASAPALRVIAKTGVGVDNIDVTAATRHGVLVLSNVGANARSVAEHGLALLLAMARNVAAHDRHVRQGTWTRFAFPAEELEDKHLGVVGFGGSGRILAGLGLAFGMRVSAWTPRLTDTAPLHVEIAASLDDLVSSVDIVSLNCPLTPQSRHMIDARRISRMRRGTWLINLSRGGLVDEAALIEALLSGQIGRAGLDVHATEPLPLTPAFYEMENVVLTPHVAGSTLQSHARTHIEAARNVIAVLAGTEVDARKIVNPDARKERSP